MWYKRATHSCQHSKHLAPEAGAANSCQHSKRLVPEAGTARDTNACMHEALAACHSCVLVSSGASRTAQTAACAAAADKRAAAAAGPVVHIQVAALSTAPPPPHACSRELWQIAVAPLLTIVLLLICAFLTHADPVCRKRACSRS